MNIFRLLGDLFHLLSIFLLIHKITQSYSCRGISFKTQCLYVVIFCSRYIDVLTTWVSLYNTCMKVFFIGSSVYILYLMKFKFRPTNDPNLDTFKLEYLLVPSFILGLILNYGGVAEGTYILESFWAFSIYLEAVAILPQLFILQRTGSAETVTTHYMMALGLYRAFYVLNWVWRFFSERTMDPIAIIAGLVQTGLYLDFGYIYFNTSVWKGKDFELPA